MDQADQSQDQKSESCDLLSLQTDQRRSQPTLRRQSSKLYSQYLDPNAYVLREGIVRLQKTPDSETMDEDSMDTTLPLCEGENASLNNNCHKTVSSDKCLSEEREVESSKATSGLKLTGRFGDGASPLSAHQPSMNARLSSPNPVVAHPPSENTPQGACGGSDIDSGNSFGKGWWKGESSKPKAEKQKKQKKDSDNGKDFGSGWWKKPSSSSSSESQGQSKRRNSTQQCHQQHSAGKRVRNDDGHSFGAGWWKGKIDNSTSTDNTNNSSRLKADTDRDSRNVTSSNLNVVNKAEANSKVVRDLVPYRVRTNPVMIAQFIEQLRSVKQEILEEEELHGRNVHLNLGAVPGMWKASLGGSKCSLLVQIHHVPQRKSSKSKSITVMDMMGHTATVVLDFLTPSQNFPPHCRTGIFVFLRAVHWHETKNGKLCIRMEDPSNVMFGIL